MAPFAGCIQNFRGSQSDAVEPVSCSGPSACLGSNGFCPAELLSADIGEPFLRSYTQSARQTLVYVKSTLPVGGPKPPSWEIIVPDWGSSL